MAGFLEPVVIKGLSGNVFEPNPDGSIEVNVVSSAAPTGGATEAKQDTGNTSLASIDTKTPALGQAAMASSVPVAIASDQSRLPSVLYDSSGNELQSFDLDNTGATAKVLGVTLRQLTNGTPVEVGSAANPLTTQLGNGTNQVSIKAAGTASTASDPALTVSMSPNKTATYGAAITGLAPAATPTDVFTITGSASKVVRIKHITVTGTQNTAQVETVLMIKRSTPNTGGTSTTLTNVPFDSTNPAATATVRAYTANPTLGTAVGTLQSEKVFIGTTAVDGEVWTYETPSSAQEITLRGTNEVLAINFNSVTVGAGASINIDIMWSEE